MKRKFKIAAVSGIVVILAPLIAGTLFIRYFDWNLAKPRINSAVSDVLKRPFAIRGDLVLQWSRDYGGDDWRSWVPWPHVTAQQIAIANPNGVGAQDNFLTIANVSFAVDPLRLLHREVAIPLLTLDQPKLHLMRSANGDNNWTFAMPVGASSWKTILTHIAIQDGGVAVDDDMQRSHLTGTVNTLPESAKSQYGVTWALSGNFKGAPLVAKGDGGALLDLRNTPAPYPVLADVRYGKTHIDVKGSLTKPAELASLDLLLKLSGASMADLYPLTGVVMPKTPAYNTEGHLIGTIGARGSEFQYEKFQGRVGSSDLEGSLDYKSTALSGRSHPLLTGRVQSNLLRFSDLGPVIGAEGGKGAAPQKQVTTTANAGGRVLPEEEFSFERWRTIDVDVQFTGRKIIRDEHLPIDNLVANFNLQNGVLSLLPLEFGVAGGKVSSDIKMDGNGSAIKADLTASIRHLKLNQLAPGFKPMETSLGEVNGNVKMKSTGNSVSQLLGASNGEAKILMGQGSISKLVLDEVGLNVLSILTTKIFGDKQVNLNCVAGDFTIKDGLMDTRDFLIDTDESDIAMTGQVDLSKEKLGLTINPKNKKFRLVSLRAPIYVNGSFSKPDVSIDKKSVALRAGGAVALGVLSPFAVMFPLVDVSSNGNSECERLIQDYKTKPQIPVIGAR
jgi:uncharacterized protein involved in outer membrane biogenesis